MHIGFNWKAAAKVITDDWHARDEAYCREWQGFKQEVQDSAKRAVKSYFMPVRAVAALFKPAVPAPPPP